MHVSNGDVYFASAWHEACSLKDVCACRMQPVCSCCGTVHDEWQLNINLVRVW
jgi:hypothetical protein